jgi:glycosyltransferase involved in cell wall biosynthesis
MKLLLVGSYLAPDIPGGAEQSAENLRTILEAAGHSIATLRWRPATAFTLGTQIAPDTTPGLTHDDWAARTWRPGEPIAVLGRLAKAEFYIMEFLTRASARDVREYIERHGIDLIIINSFRGLGYDLIDKLGRAGVPVICILHDFALACMNKGMARKGVLCTRPCPACSLVTALNRRSLARIGKLALVAPSRYVLDKVAGALQLANATRHHIPNPNSYTFIRRVRDHGNPLVLGYIGRLEVDKGVAGLLDHADRLHAACGLRLIIAGAGSLSDAVAAFAAERPWVDYRGQVPADQVHEVYNAIDVLTIPSLWPENFPGVAVHAMGSGLPCIGFDIGGLPEVIDHGQTGFVVPFGDFGALHDRVVELDRNRRLLADMSRASLDASARYDPAPLAERWVELVASMA